MSRSTARCVLAVLVLLACMVSHLQATVIVQGQGFEGKPSFQKPLTFNQFDPSLGVLQAVRLDFSLDISGGSLTVDNDSPLPTTVSVELGAKGQLLSHDVSLLNESSMPLLSGATAVSVSNGATFELAPDNGDGATFDPTLPDAEILHGGVASVSQGGLLNSASIANFYGTDVLVITAAMDLVLDFGTGGISAQFDPVNMQTNVVLTYEYSPITVPEPTGLALALVALVGLWRHARSGCA